MTKRERTSSAVNGAIQSVRAGPKWSQEESIAYECARDYLAEILGIYCYELDTEEAQEVPRGDRVTWLQGEIERLDKLRRQLRVKDHELIAEIRSVYGALLRSGSER